MEFNFTIDGSLDPVAAYAAILSTFIAIWEFLRWQSRNAVSFTCHPNMILVPSSEKKTYIVAELINKGQTQTIITNLGLYHWDKWHHRFFRKKWKNFIVKQDSIPSTVQPGAIWKGMFIQDQEIERMASEGYFYVVVFHSMAKDGVKKRVKISNKKDAVTQKKSS